MDFWVYFHVDTSRLGANYEIVSIGAVFEDDDLGGSGFHRYIMPKGSISPDATAIHGLYRHKKRLVLKDCYVEAVTLEQALRDFIRWLQSYRDRLVRTEEYEEYPYNTPIVLVAHNAFALAARALYIDLENHMTPGRGIICGFLDTLKWARSVRYKLGDPSSFSLDKLADHARRHYYDDYEPPEDEPRSFERADKLKWTVERLMIKGPSDKAKVERECPILLLRNADDFWKL